MTKLFRLAILCVLWIPAPAQAQEPIRVATWNIRWFPRGCPDGDCQATNLKRVAETISGMNADVVALQEVMKTEDSDTAVDALLGMLRAHTGTPWVSDFQTCGEPSSQQVGFIWNAARVSLSGGFDIEELNGASEDGEGPCAGFLRPGRYAYVRSLHGGVDFHLVTVHFDSGVREKDYLNRRDATRQIEGLLSGARLASRTDEDVVVLGDFNTMGWIEQSVPARVEMALVDQQIAPSYRRLLSDHPCSSYYRGMAGKLDHVLVSSHMVEAPPAAVTRGFCAERSCAAFPEESPPRDYMEVSDHCPILIEIEDADRD